MTDTATLIARLEEATEGSRELDALITLAIYPDMIECRSDLERGEGHWIHPRFGKTYALDYTTSIDAALTLVPEGYSKHINEGAHIGGASAWCCPGGGDSRGVSDPRTGATDRSAPTMALALCIAALRARSSNVER